LKKVITYGTFDLFHVGHLNLLQRAKKLGDFLIVAVSTDEFNSGKNKQCVYPYRHRAQIVEALSCVDMVIPEKSWEQKMEDVKKYGIDIFVIGNDWKGEFDFLKEFCEVVYLPRTESISTSGIRNTVQNGGTISE